MGSKTQNSFANCLFRCLASDKLNCNSKQFQENIDIYLYAGYTLYSPHPFITDRSINVFHYLQTFFVVLINHAYITLQPNQTIVIFIQM